MRPHKKKEFVITEELREEVLLFWKYEENNSTKDIMKKFNIPISPANSIIDRHIREITKKFKK